MDKETVDLLLQTLHTVHVVSVTNNQKLMALEEALRQSPELYAAYKSHLKTILEMTGDTPGGDFSALRAALLRDQD